MMAVVSLTTPQELTYDASDLPVLGRTAVYAAVLSNVQLPLLIPAFIRSSLLHAHCRRPMRLPHELLLQGDR